MRWKILPILTVVIAMLVACGPQISKPEAEVRTVTLKNIGLTSTDVNVKVKVTNNNPVGADLSKITYDLYFKKEGQWKYLGKGKKTEKVHIRKQGQTTIDIPTTINNVSALESLVPLARKGSVDIKVDGSVFLDLKATSYELPFKKITRIETEGRAPASKPQKGVWLAPPTQQASPGQGIKVETKVKMSKSGISGGEVKLSFDPSALKALEVEPGDLLGSNPLVSVKEKDNEKGLIHYALARKGKTLVPTPPGTLLSMKFKVLDSAKAGESKLTLEEVKLTNEKFEGISGIKIQGGSVKVVR